MARDETERLRGALLELLQGNASDGQRLLLGLDRLSQESGTNAHSALLLLLTDLAFDEQEARRHWTRILEHQVSMSESLGRDAGWRVAALDYFRHASRELVRPALIDLERLEADAGDASRDHVTGLATDWTFRGALQRELRRARRHGRSAAIVLFDLDAFGEVNQRWGEFVADRLLREAGSVLAKHIRDIDLAARPGEDELAVLLPETGRDAALSVAERLRREIEGFFSGRNRGGETIHLTVSAGAASYPEDATTPESLLERAARALYQAKAAGKNAARLYGPERRRFLRFDFGPGRFELEVQREGEPAWGEPRNLSRSGLLFRTAERIEIGERIEVRLADQACASGTVALRGSVVRVEELPPALPERGATVLDQLEIGIAFDSGSQADDDCWLGLLDAVRGSSGAPSSQ